MKQNAIPMFTNYRKKGQIEIQFNWIFVIVVGIIFLLFFFGIITSQTDDSEDRVSISLARNFQTILSTTGQKDDTFKDYTVPPTQLSFVCDSVEDLYHYNLGTLKAKDTKFDAIFSPETLQSRKLFTWTQEWQVPFPISTFLYVTNDNTLYIFTESESNNYRLLYSNFPENLSTFVRTIDNEVDSSINYDNYVYIFTRDQLPESRSSLPLITDNARVVVIDETACGTGFFDCGNAYIIPVDDFTYGSNLPNYFSTTGGASNFKTGYLGQAGLYGLLFSDNIARYECEMSKGYRRLRNLAALQEYRIQALISSVGSSCATNLGANPPPVGPLQSVENMKTIAESGFSVTSVNNLYDESRRLQLRNDALAILGNCPSIY